MVKWSWIGRAKSITSGSKSTIEIGRRLKHYGPRIGMNIFFIRLTSFEFSFNIWLILKCYYQFQFLSHFGVFLCLELIWMNWTQLMSKNGMHNRWHGVALFVQHIKFPENPPNLNHHMVTLYFWHIDSLVTLISMVYISKFIRFCAKMFDSGCRITANNDCVGTHSEKHHGQRWKRAS